MAGKEELKLLGMEVSPFVLRVRIALQMKRVSYEYVEEDLSNKSELLLRSNPVLKKVPVLIHNGTPIGESVVILQYVDEVFAGPALLPAAPYERARARFWAAYVDDKLFPAWLGILKAATEEERAEKAKETFAAIQRMEEAFAECSKGGKLGFFGGDSIGFLDLALGSFLFWFEALHMMYGLEIIDGGRTPLLAAWAWRFEGVEEAKEGAPELVKAVQYAEKVKAANAAAAAAK